MITELCALLGKSKQAYYKMLRRKSHALLEERVVLSYARDCRALDPGIGCMKIWHMFNRNLSGVRVGRDRFLSILYENGLKIREKFRKPRTTDSRHGLPVYPNLVKGLLVDRPNQLYVSDITYITVWTSESEYIFCYLSLVMDDYTKEIVGYAVHETLEADGCIRALNMALGRNRNEGERLIHHSDRGSQYASTAYVSLLKKHKVDISMTENGDPLENASSERINNTVKNELLRGVRFSSIEQVRRILPERIRFYNEKRPHMSLDMHTPAEARDMKGCLNKRWKRTREQYLLPEEHVP